MLTRHSTEGPSPADGSCNRRGGGAGLLAAAVLAAAAIAAYSQTFAVPLLYDDTPTIVENPTIRHWGTAFAPPNESTAGGRPTLNLSLAINYSISETSVWSYHALNLVIHIAAGLALFGIVRRTLARRAGPAALAIAFSISLLWMLHPLQTEAVTYIVQRAESLMGLFYLLTLYCFIRAAEAEGRLKSLWISLCVGSCALGMGTKEVMVSAPLIVLLYDRTFVAGTFLEAFRRRWHMYAALAATWILLAFLVLSAHGRGGTAGSGTGVEWWRYGLTQFQAISRYLRLCYWPNPLVFDYGTALAHPSLGILPYVLIVVLLIAATLWALFRWPAAGFLGASFFAILAPSSSIVPIATETMAEHRMYLPLAAVLVLVVTAIHRGIGRATLLLCVAIAAGLFAMTWRRNETYRSAMMLWNDTVVKCQENERAHANLGAAWLEMPGHVDDAIAQYEEALRLKPDDADVRNDLGSIYLKLPGRLNDAVAQYEEALRLRPRYFEAHNNLGNALSGVPGRLSDAIAQYEEALRLDPNDAEVHNNLGSALSKVPGRLNDAIAQYEEALRLRPDYVEAHNNLGNALSGMPGRLNDAIAQYEEALRLRPGDAEVHDNLGCTLSKAPGRLNDAIAQFGEALRLDPNDAETHFNLGNAWMGMPGRANDAIAQYEAALRLNPDLAKAHNNLGYALSDVPGRLNEALAQFEEALRLGPDNAEAHFRLAAVLLGLPGRRNEAKAHLEAGLRLQPENEDARRLLNNIGTFQP